ncbi:hypothetical protein SHM_02930 [Spiroplasma ixodetis]|uniref:Spiroplasmavirus-related protein n=1 Tax=Spiroplasma ixodetis TaxID=2141 RepID=A0ABM8BS23_9MOLU|nr:hypothetical protein SHM_02930 [Spiroplasma ixodetis]
MIFTSVVKLALIVITVSFKTLISSNNASIVWLFSINNASSFWRLIDKSDNNIWYNEINKHLIKYSIKIKIV